MIKTFEELIEKGLPEDPYLFEKTYIAETPVYHKHIPTAPCVHIRLAFTYGATNDPVGKEGVAHFLEHMLFKGSSLLEDEKAVDLFRKEFTLDTLNAHTSLFDMTLKAKCLPANFEHVFNIMCDMLRTPKLDQVSFDQEMKVITQEAWGRFFNNKFVTYIKKLLENLYPNVPTRKRFFSALGWPETIKNITLEDIHSAHKRYINRSNLHVFIAGNLVLVGGLESIKNIVEKQISPIEKGNPSESTEIPSSIDAPKERVFDNTYGNVGLSNNKQTSVEINFIIPRMIEHGSIGTAEENKLYTTFLLARDLITDISQEKLRTEKSLTYDARAIFYAGRDRFLFCISSEIKPQHLQEVILTYKQIREDIIFGLYADKFERCKKTFIESTVSAERLTKDIISSAVDDFIGSGKILEEKKLLKNILTVSFKDVQNLVAKHMTEERSFIEILRPNPEEKPGFISRVKNLFRK